MPEWSKAVCQTNGISMNCARTGGKLRPLILLHGLAADGTCWTDLARSLQDDFDVIMPDARGHGQSSVAVGGYRYKDHANDVVGLIQALKLASPILIGHSMGGMTAALELQTVNSNLQVERIPKAGHGLHYDQPELFATVAKSFLRSLR